MDHPNRDPPPARGGWDRTVISTTWWVGQRLDRSRYQWLVGGRQTVRLAGDIKDQCHVWTYEVCMNIIISWFVIGCSVLITNLTAASSRFSPANNEQFTEPNSRVYIPSKWQLKCWPGLVASSHSKSYCKRGKTADSRRTADLFTRLCRSSFIAVV